MEKWIGPYPVGELIGWGGFASVYRTHGPDGTPLVLKVADQSGQGPRTCVVGLRPARPVGYPTGGSPQIGGRLDPDAVREMFRAEAATLRAAAGRRLPRLIDEQLAEDGAPVLVMEELTTPWSLELAPFEDFARILEACADLQRAQLAGFFPQGPGHGDLKPEHVFLDANSEFMFIDPAYHSARGFGTVTPEYNPDPGLVTAARDVRSTAVMIYQRLTGGFPWAAPEWPATALPQLSAMADAETPVPRNAAGPTPAPSAVARWAKLVLSPGTQIGSYDARLAMSLWHSDHLAAAAQLRTAIAGHSPESA